MTPVGKGVLLAVANAFVIALGMGIVAGDAAVGLMVLMFGGVPGTAVGALLGGLGFGTRRWPIAWRRLVLIAPAVLLVVALGQYFSLDELILVSCIPTVVAALVLERSTRLVVVPPVPVARVHSA